MPLIARVAARSIERISPSFVRVEFAGPELVDFGVDGPTFDQRIKLILPPASGVLPDLRGDSWWDDYRTMPEDERGSMRTYTIREVRGEGAEVGIVVDFVLHAGVHGPGSDWAADAGVGDELLVVVPRRGEQFGGIEWAPGDASRLLLVGDETAVPAVASILGSLPAHAMGTALLEVPVAEDVQRLAAPAGVEVRWLPRDGAEVGTRAVAAVAQLLGYHADRASDDEATADVWETPTYSSSGEVVDAAPAQRPEQQGPAGWYAWIAGESAVVTALRRQLVNEVKMPRRQVAFMGYWRRGVAMA
ncbi:MAG: siderophore-interacting protein [Nocardioides sp.]|uniref:siderophore-interacting protein n=1 Tax=Nocardioides sp. TaxID=35761 RepID=UPI0039E349F8